MLMMLETVLFESHLIPGNSPKRDEGGGRKITENPSLSSNRKEKKI